MRLDELRALCAVATAGSLSTAARRLGVSQPGLSRRMQRLEDELGTDLLVRGGRGVHLTPAGERVHDFARRTLAGYETLSEELSRGETALSGTIRIVASTTPGEFLVPELVATFTAEHPAVTAHEAVTDSAGVPAALLDGEADIGFSGRRADDDRLSEEPVAQDEIVLAVPAGHELAQRSAVTVDALADEQLILREEGSGTQRTFLDTLAVRGVALPQRQSSVSLGSTRAVVSAVEGGMGIGLVSARALAEHGGAGAQAVRIVGIPVVRSLYVVFETARSRPTPVQAFIDHAIQVGRGRAPHHVD